MWVFMLKLLAFLAPKPLLNRRNVKHVKLYLSNKRLKIAAANGPTGKFMYNSKTLVM